MCIYIYIHNLSLSLFICVYIYIQIRYIDLSLSIYIYICSCVYIYIYIYISTYYYYCYCYYYYYHHHSRTFSPLLAGSPLSRRPSIDRSPLPSKAAGEEVSSMAFQQQGLYILLHSFCADSSSPQISATCFLPFHMGPLMSPQISTSLRKTSTTTAQNNVLNPGSQNSLVSSPGFRPTASWRAWRRGCWRLNDPPATVVCDKSTPPEKNSHRNISFRSTESGAGEQFVLPHCRARACTRGVVFSQTPVSVPMESRI